MSLRVDALLWVLKALDLEAAYSCVPLLQLDVAARLN
jgi:hypothetical protein